jgi:alpha-L-rhamnosidase
MHKWLRDARDSQSDTDGAYTNVVPAIKTGGKAGNAAWADAGLIVPYRLWLMYNDTEIIAQHYDSMEYYMQYLEQFGMQGGQISYGDWLNYEVTDKRYIAVCYYAYDAFLMELFSNLLGKTDRAQYYHNLREKIKAYYLETYTDSTEVLQKTQTGYLLALRFDLLPQKMREKTIKQLEKKIIDNDYTLSTGFVGTGILNQTLSDLGLDDLCYSLLLQTKDPSWLYSVRQGATTIWERWNSYTLESGFGNFSMNSFNHYAYGAVVEWIYARMIGISPDEENPGFRHFVLCPRPDTRQGDSLPKGQTNITSASGSYISSYGKICAGWAFENGVFKYDFTIPQGTTARVEFPLINGRDFVNINGIDFTCAELGGKIMDNKLICELSEGEYSVK